MSEEPKFNVKEKTPPRSGLFQDALTALRKAKAELIKSAPGLSTKSNVKFAKPGSKRRKLSKCKRKFHRVLKR